MHAEYMVQMRKDSTECGRVGRYGDVDFLSPDAGGLLNSLFGRPQTEVWLVFNFKTIVDTKFEVVGSLLLHRLGLPVVEKKQHR